LFFRALQRLAIIVFMSSVKFAKLVKRNLTNAERGVLIRGECGEALRQRGSCQVGDDYRFKDSAHCASINKTKRCPNLTA
jgi:hypothetical protein